ncbi:MAG: protein-glutamate O-methyltransferase CheR, partial [Phenylobacterium sp.]
SPVARREGFASVGELMRAIGEHQDERLVWAMVEAMTLSETSWFRDPAVFDALRDEVLPELALRRKGKAIRVWSAACGSGQEIYSLAMMLDETRRRAPRVELFGSDLCERQLEKARSGLYTQFEVQRGLSARRLVDNFEKQDDMFVLAPRLRQTVRWRRINLMDDLPRASRYELILCRNALGSLTALARAQVLESLVGALAEDGRLVLGAQEAPEAGFAGLRVVSGQPGVYAARPRTRAAA